MKYFDEAHEIFAMRQNLCSIETTAEMVASYLEDLVDMRIAKVLRDVVAAVQYYGNTETYREVENVLRRHQIKL